jgi:hypothetical protein
MKITMRCIDKIHIVKNHHPARAIKHHTFVNVGFLKTTVLSSCKHKARFSHNLQDYTGCPKKIVPFFYFFF